MSDDVKDIVRIVAGYNKDVSETGHQYVELEYKLKPLKLSFLQRLFNIDPQDPDPSMANLIYSYDINATQAQALQPYVINGLIDLNKCDFVLECYAATEDH